MMKTIFPQNYVYVLRTTTTRHIVSFIDFNFHFLANFASYVLYIYLCYVTCHTVSLGYLCSVCIVLHISYFTELDQIFQNNSRIQERGLHGVEIQNISWGRTTLNSSKTRSKKLALVVSGVGLDFPAPFTLDLRLLLITSSYIFCHRLTATSTIIVILPSQWVLSFIENFQLACTLQPSWHESAAAETLEALGRGGLGTRLGREQFSSATPTQAACASSTFYIPKIKVKKFYKLEAES